MQRLRCPKEIKIQFFLFNCAFLWYSSFYRTVWPPRAGSVRDKPRRRRAGRAGNTGGLFGDSGNGNPSIVHGFRSERRLFHVQNLSAEEAAQDEGARLPQALVHQQRAQGAGPPQGEGKGPPDLLTGFPAGRGRRFLFPPFSFPHSQKKKSNSRRKPPGAEWLL